MYKIGIDVGSTFTKYCILNEKKEIEKCYKERTPVLQKKYFKNNLPQLQLKYPDCDIITCGYGRENVYALKSINELTALAFGVNHQYVDYDVILDIGGQDIKIIRQENGHLREFFVNDRCAAGSGMFLLNTLTLLNKDFDKICLDENKKKDIKLSSVCAVFAQSEIVELIAANVEPDEIIQAVIKQIFIQAKKLLGKIRTQKILLTGGMTSIEGIEAFARINLGIECKCAGKDGNYLSAIGCALQNQ